MLIPIGILASAGAVGGAFEHIATTLVTTATPAVTFNVTALATTYKHLQIRMITQVDGSAGQSLKMRFNSVSSAGSYKDHRLYGFNGTVYSGSVYTDSIYVGENYPASEGSLFAPAIIDILDPFTSAKNTTVRLLTGKPRTTDAIVQLNSGVFLSTAALTGITFVPPANNFNTGSRFSLYGIKG